MSIRTIWGLVSLFILLSMGVGARADETSDQRPPLDQAVQTLGDEARAALKPEAAFPRQASDFAQTSGLEVPGDEVIKALSKRLDRNPVVDAYIKWQLISYEPILSTLHPSKQIRVIEAMPQLLQMGQIDRRLVSQISRYSGREPKGAEKQALDKLIAEYYRQQDQLAAYNNPAMAYQNLIIERMPPANAMNAFASIKALELHMLATTDKVSKLRGNVVDACRAIKDDQSVSPAVRTELIRRLKALTGGRPGTYTKIEQKDNGTYAVKTEQAKLPSDAFSKARAYIMGEDPPSDKK